MAPRAVFVVVGLMAVLAGCRGCEGCRRDEDESEEAEERERQRDHFWRVQIAIIGRGTVKTFVEAFECTSDGTQQRGECGPKLLRFKELAPPTMEAYPAPAWRFDHWESQIRGPDGGVHGRAGPMPDGRAYLNGFGYADTGELETVTAVFVPADRDAQLGVQP